MSARPSAPWLRSTTSCAIRTTARLMAWASITCRVPFVVTPMTGRKKSLRGEAGRRLARAAHGPRRTGACSVIIEEPFLTSPGQVKRCRAFGAKLKFDTRRPWNCQGGMPCRCRRCCSTSTTRRRSRRRYASSSRTSASRGAPSSNRASCRSRSWCRSRADTGASPCSRSVPTCTATRSSSRACSSDCTPSRRSSPTAARPPRRRGTCGPIACSSCPSWPWSSPTSGSSCRRPSWTTARR